MSKPREIADITIVLLDDGSIGISGNVGDVKLALGMMDSAREAISHRLGRPSLLEPHGAGLALPNYDVQAAPNEKIYPLNGG